MEVTHLQESDNHVVIGGAKAKGFSIATSPEFIEVLSSSLYADKPLAMMREVMCNQWDAHISADRTNKAIEIDISEDRIIFRDYGNGIPDNMIEDIYCTYGESTKRNESGTTGGFGLGSKSPFAISDVFTVTSMHNGVKTVYAVSKGSEATDHLPSLTPVVSLPTTESGLIVEIPIKDYVEDNGYNATADFLALAKKVAKYGEMNAKITYCGANEYYNGMELGLRGSELGFVILKDFTNYRINSSRIYIQYGAVIYPLEIKDFYCEEYETLHNMMKQRPRHSRLPSYATGYIIIKAPDSMLSVAPSRETLSYNKQTMQTVRDLLKNVNTRFAKVRPEFMLNAMQHTFKEYVVKIHTKFDNITDVKELFNLVVGLEDGGQQDRHDKPYINTEDDLDTFYLAPRYYPNKRFFKSYNVKQGLKHLQSFKKPRLTKYYKMFVKVHKKYHHTFGNNQEVKVYNDIMRDLYKGFGQTYFPFMQLNSISYYGCKKVSMRKIVRRDAYDELDSSTFTLVRTVYSLNSFYNRNKDYRSGINTIVKIPDHKNNPSIEVLADWLEEQGYTVNRVYGMPQHQPTKRVATAGTSKPKAVGSRTGLALLKDCVTPDFAFDYEKFKTASRSKVPDTVVYLRQDKGEKFVNGFNGGKTLRELLQLFPNTVVASTYDAAQRAEAKYNIKGGRVAISELMKQKVNDPSFLDSIATFNAGAGMESNIYCYLAQIPEVSKEFGITLPNVSATNADIILWEAFKNYLHCEVLNDFNEKVTDKVVKSRQLLPNFDKVMSAEPYLRWIPQHKLSGFSRLKPEEQKVITAMLIAALKG